MGELLVHVHLKAAYLVILRTSFAKLSDPYLIFKDTRYICVVQSYWVQVAKNKPLEKQEITFISGSAH